MTIRSLLLSLPLALFCLLPAAAQVTDSDSHTRVGDKMPAISADQASGGRFSMADQQGKVVLVNFWATWCAPCQIEMPELEKQVWQKYKPNSDFVFIAIAREQDQATVLNFQKRHPALTFPLAWDPVRAAYSQLASAGIPRNYLIDRHGIIRFQSVGYAPEDIDNLNRAIQKALAEK